MKPRSGSKSHIRTLIRQNIRLARQLGAGQSGRRVRDQLRQLTLQFGFSLAFGDCLFLDGGWYVTHTGLVRLAHRRGCSSMVVEPDAGFCEADSNRWVFKATVYRRPGTKGFVGYGDANPSNVSNLVRGAEMRVAETRAVNRALRKAYGIGLCSVEELGWLSRAPNPSDDHARPNKPCTPSGSSNGQPRLRDHLCLLIRQYNLDPALVKAYAAEFCGTQSLKEASRDLVESFISHLATWAKEDLDGLVCKLNSFAQPPEAKP
jgi:hypothetical protein